MTITGGKYIVSGRRSVRWMTPFSSGFLEMVRTDSRRLAATDPEANLEPRPVQRQWLDGSKEASSHVITLLPDTISKAKAVEDFKTPTLKPVGLAIEDL